jgi:SAM-dependent methyltransferase
MTYSRAFYSSRLEASLRSAQAVLPFVLQLVEPRSIVDFGCGTGTWLHAAKALGIPRVLGVEGSWVRRAQPLLTADELEIHDLSESVTFGTRFDLAVSLEVAEHLKPARARGFVQDLCAAADVVLFGAAIPSQGGTGHINEQWQSYWAELFRQSGYACLDVLRPRFWGSVEVLPWYKQNAFLYVKSALRQTLLDRAPAELAGAILPLDLVHPDMYVRLVKDPPLRLGMQISRRFVIKLARTLQPFERWKPRRKNADAGDGAPRTPV